MGAVGWRAGLMNLSVGKLSYWYGQWQIGQCAVSDMFCFILNKPVFQDWSLDNDLDDSLKYGAGGMKLGRLLRAALRRGWSALNSTHGAHFSGRQHVVLLQQTNIASDNISWQAHNLVPIFGLYCWSPAAWFLNVSEFLEHIFRRWIYFRDRRFSLPWVMTWCIGYKRRDVQWARGVLSTCHICFFTLVGRSFTAHYF